MPYIRKKDREKYEACITYIVQELEKLPMEKAEGELNYIISRILKLLYRTKPKYFNYNRMVGLLECVKLEAYRRWVAEYDDEKIKENGDI